MIKTTLRIALVFIMAAQTLGAAPAGPTPDSPPPAAGGVREALIEVSVDSLEISENNTNVLGLLWGDVVSPGRNSINFAERPITSLFSVAQFDRARLAGQLDALIRNNQVRVLANPTLLTKSGFE